MESEAKNATKSRKKRKQTRKKAQQEYESYIFAIDDWEWAFHFGVNQTKHLEGPYADYRHLHLRGRLLAPSRIKADGVQAILFPRTIEKEDCFGVEGPKSVGSVQLTRGQFTAMLTMPDDALGPTLQMLIAGKFRFLDMHGLRMRYGSGQITSYALEMNIDEEDMPESEIIL